MDFPGHTPHQNMMLHLFMASRTYGTPQSIVYFQRGVEWLRSDLVNPYEEDNQLYGELRHGRWSPEYQDILWAEYYTKTNGQLFIQNNNRRNQQG